MGWIGAKKVTTNGKKDWTTEGTEEHREI